MKLAFCIGIQLGIMAGIGSGLGFLLTLCRGYAGLYTRLYVRLYAGFMLFAYAKHCIFSASSTLLMIPALCASYLCDECFRFRFVLALCSSYDFLTVSQIALCWLCADFF